MPRKPKRIPTAGRRVGTKRRDMRWESPDGALWDSRFEYEVHDGFQRSASRGKVRRTEQGGRDTFSYSVPVRNATCDSCGQAKVSKHRHLTPDLFHDGTDANGHKGSYFIETKGYLRAAERSLLRAFCKARQDVSLRILYQRDFPVSKSLTITQWTAKFLKIPFAVWPGNADALRWVMPVKAKAKRKKK